VIKAEQIPDEVTQRVKALVIEMGFFGTQIRDFEAREIAAAVINAWPDAFITKYSEGAPAFNLPLTQEA